MSLPDQLPGPFAVLLDFADELLAGGRRQQEHALVVLAYGVFVSLAMVTWRHFSDQDFSFVCTLAGGVQTLGFLLLAQKVHASRSVAGISGKMLQVYVLVLSFRLSSTLVKNGYLPVCKSGDWVIQSFDVVSLLLVLHLLYNVHCRFEHTYQRDLDTMPVGRLVAAAGLLGCFLHGDMNHSPLFDTTWTVGMWLDTGAMLPQLWLFVVRGGEVEALTANFVALIFLSKCFNFAFWYTGYLELAPADGGLNLAGYAILASHGLQLLLSADFMYHYSAWQSRSSALAGMCGSRCPDDDVDFAMPLHLSPDM